MPPGDELQHRKRLGAQVRMLIERIQSRSESLSQAQIASEVGVSRHTLLSGMRGDTFGLATALRLASLASATEDEKRELVWLLMVRKSKEDRCARHFVRIVDKLKPMVSQDSWERLWEEAVEAYIEEGD